MKTIWAAAAVTLSLSLAACEKKTVSGAEQKAAAPAELKTLNIGYQKAALKLIAAKQNKMFEQAFPNVKIEWKEFPAGPQTLEALNAGSIDFGYTGDTPVIFALSGNKPIQYLAYEINFKNSHSLLVPKNSALQDIQGLKGKRIAVTKGSSAHYFLAQILKQAGLSWQDIQPVWLTPADARAALDKGSIDAWAVWDPYSSAAELKGDSRVLIDAAQLPPAYSFYLSSPEFLKAQPVAAHKIIDILNTTDDWINAHPAETVKILAKSTGLETAVAEKVFSKRASPVKTKLLDEATLAEQQKIADVFAALKLIPNSVVLKEHVWQGK
ncbi:aliphatic sulfonate ABC transporter substrate-binding protein [Acinetobacter tianfuensis]|uniref:Putative aliphatic sulfonates-binding protein n=1 Tax=Acinetobacter tianfuensis TaxID=2419603 RepID=A0A3A8EDE6_9GAMM|nr:aliphatic sulfonate ABC transporter substrate-binding protein [Acinetobacter tianfuensis]RKG32239.1 aliphatic sulfonate ABC transporter substrate-binding protein [Acinetobacter tianfuensis]